MALRSPIQSCLDELHARYRTLADGAVATYIPELAKADPQWFAICLATTDGHVYAVGDTARPFTIQSISKPFVYGLALDDQGPEAVRARIGVEPTGDAFNAISLAPGTGRPFNPMINAGAIAATSLIAGHSAADKEARLLAMLSLYAGRPLAVDADVYESERATGHRNRAIGHLLRNFDVLSGDPEPAVDLYFRQCSVAATCRDLAVMGATLANGGINPVTGEQALPAALVPDVLSIMSTCGMYDFAGEWMYRVGLPAKSGVAGGILAVLPGQLGIAVFSPPLDRRGNSVRGVAVCADLSRELGLHSLRVTRSSRAAVRDERSLATARSKRRRCAADLALLDRTGGQARVYELQGDLAFAGVESLVRRVIDHGAAAGPVIVDLRRVTRIDDPAAHVLLDLVQAVERGRPLAVVGAHPHATFLRALDERAATADAGHPQIFPDLDAALEWAEECLLRQARSPSRPTAVELREQDLCRGLDSIALAVLDGELERRQFHRGEFILRAGETAQAMYLLISGRVSVVLPSVDGQLKRLATLDPGMAFGELAVVGRMERSADVRADEASECYVLTVDRFERLARTRPSITAALLQNMLRQVHDTVSRLNRELAALEG